MAFFVACLTGSEKMSPSSSCEESSSVDVFWASWLTDRLILDFFLFGFTGFLGSRVPVAS